ncbi:hypothetical protein V7968_16355 [Nocardia vulneris]|uniref:hypothetical protein n=1 Tax=Nocardia vulneris TaxID=1141657 RepID=UPI0030CB6999
MPSEQQPTHLIFGFAPDRPAMVSVPPIEARPDQPLPNCGPFLRVFAGVEDATTVLLRCAREYIGLWRHVYEYGRRDSEHINDQLSLLTWLIDREAGGHVEEIVVEAAAPTNPSSYGEMVAWLAWKYVLVALGRGQSAHTDHDAALLERHIEAFDQLVDDVRAGVVRLPETARNVFPPQTIRPPGGNPA